MKNNNLEYYNTYPTGTYFTYKFPSRDEGSFIILYTGFEEFKEEKPVFVKEKTNPDSMPCYYVYDIVYNEFETWRISSLNDEIKKFALNKERNISFESLNFGIVALIFPTT